MLLGLVFGGIEYNVLWRIVSTARHWVWCLYGVWITYAWLWFGL